MAHSYSNILIHLIFSTRMRRRDIDASMQSPLHAYMTGTLQNLDARPLAINGVTDHVHALFALPPTRSLADVTCALKANSSRWVHEHYPSMHEFGWQNGYAAFSVSESIKSEVIQYIQRQEEHHRRRTFEEEYIGYLRLNKILFDARFVMEGMEDAVMVGGDAGSQPERAI